MAASSARRIVLSSSWPVALMRIVRPEAGWTTAAPKVGSGSCLDPSVYTHSSGFQAGHQGTGTGGSELYRYACQLLLAILVPPPICEGRGVWSWLESG